MNNTKINRLVVALLLLVLLLAAGCGQGTDDAGNNEKDRILPVPVETTQPIREDIHAQYSGTATIEAFAEAEVIAKVAGEVREILVEEGDQVRSGQVLARLDGDRLRLEVRQSEANLQKLERDYERNLDLKQKGLVSAGAFENIKYEMDALRASYELARLELSYTEIRSPIDGVVAERYIKIGNTIAVNDPVFQITNLQPLVTYMHVPEREYRKIQDGQTASIYVDALQNQLFAGTVSRISPVIDPETGTFKVTVEISDDTRRLKPGMFGRISIVYATHPDALQIPASAIIDEGGETSVFVIDDNVARRRMVETGLGRGNYVEIIAGLEPTEQLVITGQTGLKDGAVVTVVNSSQSSADSVQAISR